MAVTYGLCSAVSWGMADFSGGFATRRNNVFAVVILSQIIAGVLLLMVTLALTEGLPAYPQLIWGGVAGIAGALGIMALYIGLARGRMGIVSSIAAVVTAVIPIMFAFFNVGAAADCKANRFRISLCGGLVPDATRRAHHHAA